MQQARSIFIGDVHGCSEELRLLLSKLGPVPGLDRLIFLGDLLNKGPDSLGVLELVQSLDCQVITGNHELAFLRGVESGSLLSVSKPSRTSMRTVYEQLSPDLDRWVRFIQSFLPYIEDDAFIAVHAGLRPDLSPAETSVRELASIRTWDGKGKDLQNSENPAWYSLYNSKKPVIYGHWALQGLNFRENTIGLDSGCVYGRYLSALILEERRLVSVKAKKAYCLID